MIQADRMEMLEEYARLMGITVEQCIDEALFDWLTVTAPQRLGYIISQKEKSETAIPSNIIDIRTRTRMQV